MKLVVIGGVAGGASAAARARRLDEELDIVLFERGEHVSFANCGMPYHIGGVIPDRDALLVQTPTKLKARYALDIRVGTEVTHIDREAKNITWRVLETGEEGTEGYDKLILSPGAMPFRPPIDGIENDRVFTLRNLADMDRIKSYIDKGRPQKAIVVGAGFIGIEMVENLRHRGMEVALVELLDQVMPQVDPEMAAPLQQELADHGVELYLGRQATAFEQDGDRLRVRLKDAESLDCDLIVMSVGVRPDASLAEGAGLSVGDFGGIVVDAHLRTSDADIYAVGDAVVQKHLVDGKPAYVPLAGPANRQGRIAADNVLGRESTCRDVQGTAIVQAFHVSLGSVGMSEKALERQGVEYEKCYIHPMSHASYYPGAQPVTLKLLFSKPEGKILGAFAVGADGVDKRIDVLATAQRAGMTVFDLEHLELCYSPQHGAAKDPVNMAGFVASNILRGDTGVIHVPDLVKLDASESVLLDVREPEEHETGHIPGSTLIPLGELRQRSAELPKDKKVVVYCQVGLRGYLAGRQLRNRGFEVRNLSGGYRTYCQFNGHNGTGCNPASQSTQRTEDDGTFASPPSGPTLDVDACGLQCPGPILKIKENITKVNEGGLLRVSATDAGFARDVPAWCHHTGNELLSVNHDDGRYVATIRRGKAAAPAAIVQDASSSSKKTIIVFSSDLDRVMAGFVIANGAASMGDEVTMFFTFWGLNVLRKESAPPVSKGLMDRMFGWMMPKGPERLKLSKMNMGGMGTMMMKSVMAKKNVASLPELIESAQKAGVRLVACTMSMDVMGIQEEELMDGVEYGGVALYLDKASEGSVNLFI